MNRDGTISVEFQLDLPRVDSSTLGGALWGRASGAFKGRANPQAAIASFDATGQRPFESVSAEIQQNVNGWACWGTNEIFRRYATDRDIAALLGQPSQCHEELISIVRAQFDPWGFVIESIELTFTLDPAAVAALPEGARAQFAPPSQKVAVEHQFTGDIPAVRDPLTNKEINCRCAINVTLQADSSQARAALDPGGTLDADRLHREILSKAEEWFWYGVKQSFYNWIYDPQKQKRGFIRDYSLIHPDVMALAGPGLAQIGVNVDAAMVRYEALDADSAWALTAPGQTGQSPIPRGQAAGKSPPSGGAAAGGPPPKPEQAMAATIALVDPGMDEPTAIHMGDDGDLPSIEEAVWRHQKRAMKQNPGKSKEDYAVEILRALKEDGYGFIERKALAHKIGGHPDMVTD